MAFVCRDYEFFFLILFTDKIICCLFVRGWKTLEINIEEKQQDEELYYEI